VQTPQGIPPAHGLADVVPGSFEEDPNQIPDVRLVVDDEHAGSRHAAFIPNPGDEPGTW
jgi:hypothetical protein